MTRRVLEQCLRDRVLADAGPRLRLRDQTRVTALLWDEVCRSVLGERRCCNTGRRQLRCSVAARKPSWLGMTDAACKQ